MKKLTGILVITVLAFTSCKQEVKVPETPVVVKEVVTEVTKKIINVKTIALEQIDGEFTQKELTLDAGTYVFEISNKDIDHEVGFVLAPKGKTEPEHHIKTAYVTSPVPTGSTSKTNEVVLTAGEYVYFCPLNPTPQYTLIVN